MNNYDTFTEWTIVAALTLTTIETIPKEKTDKLDQFKDYLINEVGLEDSEVMAVCTVIALKLLTGELE